MTDRLKGLRVVLDEDIREDDAQAIMDAIRMFQHVLDVAPIVFTADDWMARTRVRNELKTALWAVLMDESKETKYG